MQAARHALVLTGQLLPGYAAETVWPALAAYLRMPAEQFETSLRARAPVSVKQSDDLAKLQSLQAGINAVGAEADIFPDDASPNLFVLIDNVARGPLPRSYVEDGVRRGVWPDSVRVAAVGSNEWIAFAALTSTGMAARTAPVERPAATPGFSSSIATPGRLTGNAASTH